MRKKTKKAAKTLTVAPVDNDYKDLINELNLDCKEIVKNHIVKLFSPERGIENYNILYNLIYYISQEAAFMHMPMGQIKHALEKASDEAIKAQLDWLANKYNLVGEKEPQIPSPVSSAIN